MSADAHSLIGAWVLGAVDEEERALVEAHLAAFPSCAREAVELREAIARLAQMTLDEPPPRLRNRVLAAARRTRQDVQPGHASEPSELTARRVRRLGRPPRLHEAFAAAALGVAIAVAGGVLAWSLTPSPAPDVTRTDQVGAVVEAEDATVDTVTAAGGGQVTVVSSAALDQAVVIVDGLPSVGEDRSYQLWLVDPGGPVSAGVMEAGDSSATMLVEDIAGADAFGVTDEPAGGSEVPTLPMVAGVVLVA